MEWVRMSAAEYRKQVGKGAKLGAQACRTSNQNKYNAKRVEINGVQFDSKKEAQLYQKLENLQRMGIISDLQRQVRFELVPKQKDERAVHYVADYVFKEGDKHVVADCKSAMTKKLPVYVVKRKLFKWCYPEYEFREM